MKQLKSFILLFIVPFFIQAEHLELTLNGGWQFRKADQESWKAAQVPGTVHTDLWNNNVIEDPYFSLNRNNQKWIEESNWEYKTVFQASSEIITKDQIVLDFKGLDTFADVYLNDSLILNADNMFRRWVIDVDGIIKSGNNELRIFFHSPIKHVRQIIDDLNDDKLIVSKEYSESQMSLFARKPAYHFGWNGNQGIATLGIWRPIVLRAWDIASIEEFSIQQKSAEKNEAQLIVHFEYRVTRPTIADLEVHVDGEMVKKIQLEMVVGNHADNISLSIKNPELWWPNGLGDQKLYEINVVISKDGKKIASRNTRIGLRTIELIPAKDKDGINFHLTINGKQLFIKGANYMPQNYFLPTTTLQQYNHLLQLAADANINMLKVWGGGIYEQDMFYDLCDENGLLVWQDFMFTPKTYMINDQLIENIRSETSENVKRLNNHPCLALWSLDSNILQFDNTLSGLESNKHKDEQLQILESSNSFRQSISEIVETFGNGVPFWDNSSTDNVKRGQAQNWLIQQNEELFGGKDGNAEGFTAEFGFQSYPSLKTIKTFAEEKNWDFSSEVMKAHSQARKVDGNENNSTYFNAPKDFRSAIYISQLVQAEKVKALVEAQRLKQTYNMNILLWQLNDSWPAISSSFIDFQGEGKPAYYYLKRAFQQSIPIFEINDEDIKIHVGSDVLQETKATMIVELLGFNGKKVFTEEKKIKIKPGSNKIVWKTTLKELLKKQKKDEVYITARLMDGENLIRENYFIFIPYKELSLSEPDIRYEFIEKDNKFFVKLISEKTAFGVWLEFAETDVSFSDNCFILNAKKAKVVEIKSKKELSEIKNGLIVKSLIDSY